MGTARNIRAGRASVELSVNAKRLTDGLNRAGNRLRRFGASVRQIGRQIATIGLGLTAPFLASLAIFRDFDDSMRTLKGISGAVGAEFNSLTQTIKRLGRETSFTAKEVAEGGVALARGGFDPQEIQESIGDILNLARATRTELPDAVNISVKAMRAFGIQAEETTRVVDALTAATNIAPQILEELGDSLKFVAPFAKLAGQSLEDTVAAISVIASQGQTGTVAGTSLARMYKNLAQEGKKVSFGKLSVEIGDANDNFLPLVDILKQFNSVFGKLGSRQQAEIFEKTFGRGAVAALNLSKNTFKFEKALARVSETGTAESIRKTIEGGLGGAFLRARSAVEGLALAIGEALSPAVSRLLAVATKYVRAIAEWVEEHQQVIVQAGKLAAGILILGTKLFLVGVAISGIATTFFALKGLIAATAVAFAFLSTPIGLAIVAATSLGVFFELLLGTLTKFRGELDKLSEGISDLAGRFSRAVKNQDLQFAFDQLFNDIKIKFAETMTALSQSWLQFTSSVKSVWQEVTFFLERQFINLGEVFNNALKGVIEQSQKFLRSDIGKKLFGENAAFGLDFFLGTAGKGALTDSAQFERNRIALEDSQESRRTASQKEFDDRFRDIAKDLGKRRKELRAELQGARERQFVRRQGLNKPFGPKTLKETLEEELGKGSLGGEGERVGVAGSFNAQVAATLGAGGQLKVSELQLQTQQAILDTNKRQLELEKKRKNLRFQ